MSSEKTTSVAVLGTGTMGAPMARNMVAAGLSVRVWNRSPQKAEAVAREGAAAAVSPRAAADGADMVVSMLSDGEAVESAMTADGGALAAMSDDALWLQMSTVGIEATERLLGLASERGVAFVDAPVLGTKQPAEQGELIVLASGSEAALGRAQPVFDAVGASTVRAGEAGGGTRLKLVLNAWLLTLVGGLAETIAFAETIGVDPQQFLDTIEGGPLGPAYAQLKGAQMLEREFPASFSLRLARKDAGLVRQAAAREGGETPLVEVIARQMDRAIELGHGDEDMAATFFASARPGH